MTTAARGALVRQVTVSVAYVVCLAGSLVGVGVFGGTPIAEAADGLLSADATHLAPASAAFSVWTVIYIALGAYTVWQWWDRTDERRIAWLVVASLVLNAGWILSVQAGSVGSSVAVIVALLAVLAETFRRLLRVPPRSWVEAVAADGTVGLYLGWVSEIGRASCRERVEMREVVGGVDEEQKKIGAEGDVGSRLATMTTE